MTDSIEQPAHYNFGMMEAREIIEVAIADIPDPVAAYHVATTLKYFLRTSRKGWTEDIAKGCKHAGWALDAARAHDVRESKQKKMYDGFRLGCLAGCMIPPPHYDPDSVAFRHGDIDAVCDLPAVGKTQPGKGIREAGEFTQPPNCVHESPKSNELGHVETVDGTHPMAAEGLRLADEQPCNQPRRSESAWSVTWPSEVTRPSDAAARARLELIEGAAKASADAGGRAYPNLAAAQTAFQTLVGN